MVQINFFIVADKAEVKMGKLSIEGIFDSINSFNFPAKHKSLVVVINFEIDPGKHSHYFKVKHQDGTEAMQSSVYEFESGLNQKRHQFLHTLNGLLLLKEGKYIIEAYLDGILLGETYFIAKNISQTTSYA